MINLALALCTKRYSGGITVWKREQEQETDEYLYITPEEIVNERETYLLMRVRATLLNPSKFNRD